jgi:ABC-2 type transport system ATP-binding protein
MGLAGPRGVDSPIGADDAVVSVRDLRKLYGSVEAVAGIDLDVRRGEILAFLGPNGAGKTTTVEILEGFRDRSGGDVSVLGVDPAHGDRDWRDRLGVVLQESAPEPGLSVRECLELYAGYYDAPRPIDETISLVGLDGKSAVHGEQLSGGQRRRLDVALALIGDPDLIFLDEPTTGFDPSARRTAWDVISGLRELGKTVFLTTHYMDEAEHLADRIAVIANGVIVATGTPQTLGGRDHMPAVVRFTLPFGIHVADLPAALQPRCEMHATGAVMMMSELPLSDLGVLAGWAGEGGFDLPDLDVRRPSLEDVYLSLTDTREPA